MKKLELSIDEELLLLSLAESIGKIRTGKTISDKIDGLGNILTNFAFVEGRDDMLNKLHNNWRYDVDVDQIESTGILKLYVDSRNIIMDSIFCDELDDGFDDKTDSSYYIMETIDLLNYVTKVAILLMNFCTDNTDLNKTLLKMMVIQAQYDIDRAIINNAINMAIIMQNDDEIIRQKDLFESANLGYVFYMSKYAPNGLPQMFKDEVIKKRDKFVEGLVINSNTNLKALKEMCLNEMMQIIASICS